MKRKNRTARRDVPTSVEATIVHGLQANPDVQTVMEIAMRARSLEEMELPLEIDTLTEVRATPVSSQGLW
jgi:hypothetical protein